MPGFWRVGALLLLAGPLAARPVARVPAAVSGAHGTAPLAATAAGVGLGTGFAPALPGGAIAPASAFAAQAAMTAADATSVKAAPAEAAGARVSALADALAEFSKTDLSAASPALASQAADELMTRALGGEIESRGAADASAVTDAKPEAVLAPAAAAPAASKTKLYLLSKPLQERVELGPVALFVHTAFKAGMKALYVYLTWHYVSPAAAKALAIYELWPNRLLGTLVGITGQTLGDLQFRYNRRKLAVLKEIARIPGVSRIRVLSSRTIGYWAGMYAKSSDNLGFILVESDAPLPQQVGRVQPPGTRRYTGPWRAWLRALHSMRRFPGRAAQAWRQRGQAHERGLLARLFTAPGTAPEYGRFGSPIEIEDPSRLGVRLTLTRGGKTAPEVWSASLADMLASKPVPEEVAAAWRERLKDERRWWRKLYDHFRGHVDDARVDAALVRENGGVYELGSVAHGSAVGRLVGFGMAGWVRAMRGLPRQTKAVPISDSVVERAPARRDLRGSLAAFLRSLREVPAYAWVAFAAAFALVMASPALLVGGAGATLGIAAVALSLYIQAAVVMGRRAGSVLVLATGAAMLAAGLAALYFMGGTKLAVAAVSVGALVQLGGLLAATRKAWFVARAAAWLLRGAQKAFDFSIGALIKRFSPVGRRVMELRWVRRLSGRLVVVKG